MEIMLERHHKYNSCTNEVVNSGEFCWLVGHLQRAGDLGAPHEFSASLATASYLDYVCVTPIISLKLIGLYK